MASRRDSTTPVRGQVLGWSLAFLLVASVLATHESASADGFASRATLPQVVPESALPFSPNLRVSEAAGTYLYQVEPYVVLDPGGRLFVGYKEADTADGPGKRVAFSRSLDGGFTWSAPSLMALGNANRAASDPWLAIDESGRLHFARLDYSPDLSYGGLAISSSDDGGTTWTSLADPDDRAGFADKESMTSDGNGTLYVAYDDLPDPNGELADLRFARSTDAGATWSPTTPVADAIGNLLGPVLAARPDGTVHAVWWNLTEGNIMADISRDRGSTWGTDVRVNAVAGSARYVNSSWAGSLPSVAVDSVGRIFVAWADRGAGNLDILVARSDDGGSTWSSPARVNDDTSQEDQWMPSLAVDGRGVLHAAWLDQRTGNSNVYYSNSTDGGRTWSTNVRVTTAETPRSFVRPGDYLGLAADRNGTAYVVWTDGRNGDLDIYFARSSFSRLSVSIAAEPPSGPVPLTVVFHVVLAGGVPPYSYEWEFGDGENSTIPNAAHTYGNVGNWTVTLTLTDASGERVTANAHVLANPPAPPWALYALIAVPVAIALLLFVRWRRMKPRSR